MGKDRAEQKGNSRPAGDVFKRTITSQDGDGSHVLIYGKLKPGEVDISGVLADVRTFAPKPKGKLPDRLSRS